MIKSDLKWFLFEDLKPLLSFNANVILEKKIPNNVYEYEGPLGRPCVALAKYLQLTVQRTLQEEISPSNDKIDVVTKKHIEMFAMIFNALVEHELIKYGTHLAPFAWKVPANYLGEKFIVGTFVFSDLSIHQLNEKCGCSLFVEEGTTVEHLKSLKFAYKQMCKKGLIKNEKYC